MIMARYSKPIQEMDRKTIEVYNSLLTIEKTKEREEKKMLAAKYNISVDRINAVERAYVNKESKPVEIMPMEQPNIKDEKLTIKHKPGRKVGTEAGNICGLTDDQINEFISDVKSGMPIRLLAEKYYISKGSVSRIKSKYGITGIVKGHTTQKAAAPAYTKPCASPAPAHAAHKINLMICRDDVISVGMVADRHIMPVKDYIFKGALSQALMFNFDKQEAIVEQYIREHIPFRNGVPTKCLCVYATGLQMVFGSIVRVCFRMKINLTIMHYNVGSNNSYSPQVIWDCFKSAKMIPDCFRHNYMNFDSIYCVDSNYNEVNAADKFYSVTVLCYKNKVQDKQKVYIAMDKDTAFDIYCDMLKETSTYEHTAHVYLSEDKINRSPHKTCRDSNQIFKSIRNV